ncbi:hypothetical protein SAMN04487895_12515 [Paenibacillus sophorae]|uniref:Uncharacterized protein n=1 Tax=Paenibacillus sophorae TaxID=1333845 RepID=A0A1H8VJX8_9BACL|nr:hypothetical protein [Paenibacillus sophorae]QWU17207.1 hypothetical protein KP014_08610 [Paenibacillus sophorae]SEP15701.1 hypothetical protein SAMN04487895_12515 [Paenibacillus sophorae]
MRKTKLAFTGVLVSALIFMSASAYASPKTIDEFEKHRLEVVNQELTENNLSPVTDLNSELLQKEVNDEKTKDKVEKLKKAEIVLMTFDENGQLVEADSSEKGNVISRFGKDEKKGKKTEIESTDVNALSILPDSYPAPAGSTTGAFHRLISPASTTSLSYTGAVADDVTLPNYDVNTATTYQEAAYLYSGIDQSGVGIAEVGFGTYKGTQGNGWFALFHARAAHDITTPSTGDDYAEYYYDFANPYSGGQTITGYKVYYHTYDSVLTITYQINYSTIYVVKFNGYNSLNKSVKRVTAIAMPSTTTGKFHVSYGSYANWGNYRWLTNDGTGTVYPGAVSGVSESTWSHGGAIDFIKTVYSGTDRDEQYKIY